MHSWVVCTLFIYPSFSDCSMKEYENRAVELATNPAKLQALTNKLKEVRLTCPLFDTARWVRDLLTNSECSCLIPAMFSFSSRQ
jgi:hypothetical protein